MARGSPHLRDQMRNRLAQLAARLIAEDGIDDYALAKRKAARQLGADDTRHLPTNAEVEQAVRDYHAIYQQEEQRARLRALRTQALAVMRLLADFDPHLTGSVLAGTANRYSNIDLMLFADSPKDVELFLLNRNIPFRPGERRLFFGDGVRAVPVLTLSDRGEAEVVIAVLNARDLRQAPRSAAEGRALEKARIAEVESLLDAAT